MSFMDDYASTPEPRDIWVVGEVGADGRPTPLTLEIVGGGRMMADSLGCYVHAVVLGSQLGEVGPELISAGADKVHLADDDRLKMGQVLSPEACAKVLGDLFAAQLPEIVLMGDTWLGNHVAPRLAQRFNTGLLAHCIALQMDESERVLVGTHPVFEGEYSIVEVCPTARPEIATVQPNTFGQPYLDSYRFGDTETMPVELPEGISHMQVVGPADYKPADVPLRKARRIVSVGRQAGDPLAARELAGKLAAQMGGAREALDEGWITEEQVVGALGELVHPDLYVAVGIRGDSYHTFGVRDARFIVAIHPDKDAPVFQIADAGLVGDPAELVPQIIQALE